MHFECLLTSGHSLREAGGSFATETDDQSFAAFSSDLLSPQYAAGNDDRLRQPDADADRDGHRHSAVRFVTAGRGSGRRVESDLYVQHGSFRGFVHGALDEQFRNAARNHRAKSRDALEQTRGDRSSGESSARYGRQATRRKPPPKVPDREAAAD